MNGLSLDSSLISWIKEEEKSSMHLGIIVGDIDSKSPTFAYQEDQFFVPASCQKVLVASMAIKELGEYFKYKTTLEYLPSDNKDNYQLCFSGDPTLTSEDVKQLLLPLKGKRIKGSLKIDHSAYQTPGWSPHIMPEDIGSDYTSPLLAAIIDRNAFKCLVYPEREGKGSYVEGLDHIQYICKAISSETCTRSRIDVAWQEDCLIINASLPKNEKYLEVWISHPSAKFILEIYLNKILKDLDIQFEEGVEFIDDVQSVKGEVLKTHYSPSLKGYLPVAMKQSDNLVYDTLYLTLLHQAGKTKWSEGNEVFKELFAKHLKLDFSENYMVDGSGASRENKISPSFLWQVLNKEFEDKFFVSLFPQPGEKDTTLENRTDLPSSVIAKTGTMRGISGLCGYINSPINPQAFVIFQHQPCLMRDEFYNRHHTILQCLLNS